MTKSRLMNWLRNLRDPKKLTLPPPGLTAEPADSFDEAVDPGSVSPIRPNIKLNVGCGTDYREGFINIDGSNTLPRVDKIIDISSASLLPHFTNGEMDYILANDIIEHHYHWEAVRILKEFHALLRKDGQLEIRVPDAEFIIATDAFSISNKLNLLFGGQDVPQGRDPKMDESRNHFPQFFCHKYGWTMDAMKKELCDIGFSSVRCQRADTNFIAYAKK